jgi:transposase InsO family protein
MHAKVWLSAYSRHAPPRESVGEQEAGPSSVPARRFAVEDADPSSQHMCLRRGPVPLPAVPNESWSMDFVHDQLLDRRPFRVLTVMDQLSRESPLIETDFSMLGYKVAAALDRWRTGVATPTSRRKCSRKGRGNTASSSISRAQESP